MLPGRSALSLMRTLWLRVDGCKRQAAASEKLRSTVGHGAWGHPAGEQDASKVTRPFCWIAVGPRHSAGQQLPIVKPFCWIAVGGSTSILLVAGGG